MADLTAAQLRALYSVAKWAIVGGSFLDDFMREECGRNWRRPLTRAMAECSRELAEADFVRKRRRRA